MPSFDRRAAFLAAFAIVVIAVIRLRAEPPALTATAVQTDDLKDAPRGAWDAARDLPPDIHARPDIKWDYPIAYVRIPRPYPKEYFGINHLNQAGLHQTNA